VAVSLLDIRLKPTIGRMPLLQGLIVYFILAHA